MIDDYRQYNKPVPTNEVLEQIAKINDRREVLKCFKEGLITEDEAINLICDDLLRWAGFFDQINGNIQD